MTDDPIESAIVERLPSGNITFRAITGEIVEGHQIGAFAVALDRSEGSFRHPGTGEWFYSKDPKGMWGAHQITSGSAAPALSRAHADVLADTFGRYLSEQGQSGWHREWATEELMDWHLQTLRDAAAEREIVTLREWREARDEHANV